MSEVVVTANDAATAAVGCDPSIIYELELIAEALKSAYRRINRVNAALPLEFLPPKMLRFGWSVSDAADEFRAIGYALQTRYDRAFDEAIRSDKES